MCIYVFLCILLHQFVHSKGLRIIVINGYISSCFINLENSGTNVSSFLQTASKEGRTNKIINLQMRKPSLALSSGLANNCLVSALAKTGTRVSDVVITTVETTEPDLVVPLLTSHVTWA